MTRARELGCGVLCVIALACVHRNPYQERRELQRAQAKAYAPAQLEREDKSWRSFRPTSVRIYVDPAYAKRDGAVRKHFDERLVRANEVTEPVLGLRLSVEDVRELPQDAASQDLDTVLTALERLDPGEEVDFVVALVGNAPVATLAFHELGRARLLGRHIVMRAMDDAQELSALQTYDTLDREERSRLYQQRKRHKEAAVLLHEIGHTLGALHVRDPADLMCAHYDQAMEGFAPPNVELMKLVLAQRVLPADQRDLVALVRDLKAQLEQATSSGFVTEERTQYLAELDRVLVDLQRPPPAAEPVPARSEPEGLSALSEADRTRYGELDALKKSRDYESLAQAVRDLAARYPDSYAVQHKACELAMQIGLAMKELRKYCDRMAVLAAQPPSAP